MQGTKTVTLAGAGRDGSAQRKVMAAVRGGVTVLAGNFPDADGPKAQAGLRAIKKPENCPPLLRPDKKRSRGWTGLTESGGMFKLLPGYGDNKTPLSRAFLTTNPLLPADRVRDLTRKRDPLLVRLNAGREHGLAGCPGKYTLAVAQFRGNSVVQVAGVQSRRGKGADDLSLDDIDEAGKRAWELCQVLRNRDKVEAYVWHDRHRSVVTVGSFASADDPALLRLARRYAAHVPPGQSAPTPRMITVPKTPKTRAEVKRLWLLDPAPFPMEVPSL